MFEQVYRALRSGRRSRLHAIMFCRQCQAEYRQGFTRCSDCDVDLVYSLTQESPAATDAPRVSGFAGQEGELRPIWRGNDEAACLALCRELLKVDIPYKVAQTPAVRDLKMRVKWQYEIGVVHQDYQSAKELLGIEGEFADSCCDEKDKEEGPAADTAESIPPDDSPHGAEIRNDSYLEHWYPEDATVEIWSQDGDDISSGVEMALKENLVHCRLERQDGVCKAFVLPEDEPRAREIVLEITEGRPPT
jgi:hypothetical protein